MRGGDPDRLTGLPVARVLVDVPLPHLDRPFDYRVPEAMLATAVPGCRVRVRFSGRLVSGFVLQRRASSDHGGKLAPLARVTSSEPVLSPEVARLCRAIADRWVGSMSDVLRLAVPPRHARVESSASDDATRPPVDGESPLEHGWGDYRNGEALMRALARTQPGGSGPERHPRAVWTARPGEDWPRRWAEAAAAAAAAGRGVVLVVADQRDLARVDAALTGCLGSDAHVALTADLGAAQRYRRFLKVSRGQARVVVGTRAACYSPVTDLGLVGIWDDGDDLHCEPHAPYAHARDVLLLRAHLTGSAAILGGWSRTAEAQRLVARGWARDVVASRETVRLTAPQVVSSGDDVAVARDTAGSGARLPHVAFDAARSALARDEPVLVQVPRGGYRSGLSCARCRTPARCAACQGPMEQRSSHAIPACAWCGRPVADWSCAVCTGRSLRSSVIGAGRTVEELGRAFPGVPVQVSRAPHVLDEVAGAAAVVVATPGAEPVADGGYGACLLLDAWLSLGGVSGLRGAEESLRRWFTAAALVRPASSGGTVVVTADPSLRPVQALVRWDPGWAAQRELAEREELRFPPAAAVVSLTAVGPGIADLLEVSGVEASALEVELLGPVALGPPPGTEPYERRERLLVRVSSDGLAAVSAALRRGQGIRSARKAPDPVRVQVNPYDIG